MKSNLSTEEMMKLTELKTHLLNAQNQNERHSTLKEIEQLLNKAKYRHKFMSALNEM